MMPSVKSSPKFHIALIILSVLLGGLLSACAGNVDMDITIYSGDRYQQETLLTFSEDAMAYIEGAEEIELMLDELVAEAKEEGIDLSWKQLKTPQGEDLQYEIQQGITKITDSETNGFSWQEITHNNEPAYEFKYTDISDMGMYFQSFTLTLHAGKILESNGTEVNARTVRWVNPSTTPIAIVQPKGSTWIPLAGAGLLLVIVAGIVVMLVVTGRLQNWFSAGVSAGKWRVQSMKLKNDRARVEKEKIKLLSELGDQAWVARVEHPSYAEIYNQLESLEEQRAELNEQRETIEQQLHQIQQTRDRTESEYATRIVGLQDELKDTNANLDRIQAEKTALEKRLGKARVDQKKTQEEIQSLRDRLSQVQEATEPDWEAQAASISNAIMALEQSLPQINDEMPQMQSDIANLEAEQQSLTDEVERLEEQIAQAKGEQREALAPLDEQIADLQKEIQSITKELTTLTRQMKPLIDDLGPHVDRARPEAPALADLYAELDRCYRELEDISRQHDLLKVRLEASDTGAVRNFYLFVAGLLLALILIAILLSMGLS